MVSKNDTKQIEDIEISKAVKSFASKLAKFDKNTQIIYPYEDLRDVLKTRIKETLAESIEDIIQAEFKTASLSVHEEREIINYVINSCLKIKSGALNKKSSELRDLRKPAITLWKDRDKELGHTPLDFIQFHYGDRLALGLSQVDIKYIDSSLYSALRNWLSKNKISNSALLPKAQGVRYNHPTKN